MIEIGSKSFPEIFHKKGMAQEVFIWEMIALSIRFLVYIICLVTEILSSIFMVDGW